MAELHGPDQWRNVEPQSGIVQGGHAGVFTVINDHFELARNRDQHLLTGAVRMRATGRPMRDLINQKQPFRHKWQIPMFRDKQASALTAVLAQSHQASSQIAAREGLATGYDSSLCTCVAHDPSGIAGNN